MREFVAVDHIAIAFDLPALKQQALMFDRIAIPQLQAFLAYEGEERKEANATLRWLQEAGIVFEPTLKSDAKISIDEYRDNRSLLVEQSQKLLAELLGFSIEELIEARGHKSKTARIKKKIDQIPEKVYEFVEGENVADHAYKLATYITRLISIELREVDGLQAVPLLPVDIAETDNDHDLKNSVIKIVLNSLPVPDDETSWEQIVEYRDDQDSKNKFLDLRNWMSEVARGELTPVEAEEQLEYLLSLFRRGMEIHRMKANTIVLESLVVTSADLARNLLTLRWGEIAKGFFSIRHRKIALLEGELTAQGSEVAYIIKARDVFSTPS
ncbi:MAG: hypothetical protein H0U18_06490 [Pyrinomonadaceae bacterium]|jgi:hypothetical protein|nr:hypothetical protein [Pyrinomonadaceae bacterium]